MVFQKGLKMTDFFVLLDTERQNVLYWAEKLTESQKLDKAYTVSLEGSTPGCDFVHPVVPEPHSTGMAAGRRCCRKVGWYRAGRRSSLPTYMIAD